MKRETSLLKLVIFFITLAAISICIFLLPRLIYFTARDKSILLYFIVIVCISTIPFFIIVYQVFKLLQYIDKREAFGNLSVKALINIKRCLTVITILYAVALPILYLYADKVDAPGVLVIGIVVDFAAFACMIFTTVLQKLLQQAIDMKNENDLTI